MRRSAYVTAVRVTALALALACALPYAALAQEVEPTADALEEQIRELRPQASYTEAVEIARELVALRKGDPDAKPYQIADAERLLETLQYIAGLPNESQRELVLADSLNNLGRDLQARGDYVGAESLFHEALTTRMRLLGDENLDVAASMSDLAYLLYAEGNWADAEPLFRETLAMWRNLLGDEHPDVATALDGLAVDLWAQGDYAEAEALYRESLAMRRRLLGDEHLDVARSLNNLAYLLHAQGHHAGVAPLHREALAIRRRFFGDEHLDVASSLSGLANALKNQGDYAGVEPLYREALAIRRGLLGNDHRDVASSLTDLARFLQVRGDYGDADLLLRDALAMRRRLFGDEHTDVAASLNNLAYVLQDQGDYVGAEPLYREALAMRRRLLGNEHERVATSLNNLAYLLDDQGDYVSAEPLYREALAMQRKLLGDEHPFVATSLNNLACLLQDRGDYASAEPLCRGALAMRRRLFGEEHPRIAESLNNLASLLGTQGGHADAELLSREALAMFRRLFGDEHPSVANGLNSLAGILDARGDWVGAESLHREALAVRRRLLGDEHPDVAQSLNSLAGILMDRGNYAGSELLLAEAARVYDSARLRAGAGLKRAAFQESPYPILASVRLALGRADEAWPAAEKIHARSLADLLMAAAERDLSPSESAREDSLKVILGNLERELAAYRRAATSDTTGEAAGLVEVTRNALLAAESEWSAFHQDIAAKYPVTEGETFPLVRVQSALSQEIALIGWLDVSFGDDAAESWCYAIRNSGPVAWERAGSPVSSDDSRSQTDRGRSFRDHLASPASPGAVVTRESRDLWSERIGPLERALEGAEKLIVIPSGAMLGVPVEALIDDEGVPAGETYAVSYVPSATLHAWLVERADRDMGSGTLLVGDPPYNPGHLAAMRLEEDALLSLAELSPGAEVLRSALAGNQDALAVLPRLHGTRGEVAAVAAVSEPSSLLLGPEASEQELVRLAESGELGEFSTIHVATHALVDDERPERSALVLSQVDLPDALEAAMAGTRIYDGLVTAKEIVREWDLNADLVTLSACETGLGKKVMGEGYVGFAHAFLQAGARSLLVSLWRVEDTATSLLMRRFYENWRGEYADERNGRTSEPMSKADALREAKYWLRSFTDDSGRTPYEHPYYWSAFVLIGDRS